MTCIVEKLYMGMGVYQEDGLDREHFEGHVDRKIALQKDRVINCSFILLPFPAARKVIMRHVQLECGILNQSFDGERPLLSLVAVLSQPTTNVAKSCEADPP